MIRTLAATSRAQSRKVFSRHASKKASNAGKKPVPKEDGAAAVSKTRINTKVADEVAKTKAARQQASSGGSLGGLAVLGVGLIGGGGYTAYKLNTDSGFATTLRQYGAGALVNGIGKIIPLAKEKNSVPPTAEIDVSAAASDVTAQSVASNTASTTATGSSNENVTSTQDDVSADGAAAEMEKENAEASSASAPLQKTSEEQAADQTKTRQEEQENAIAAVVAAGTTQESADKSVQSTVDSNQQEAAAIANEKPKQSEMERLRDNVRDIERTVAEQQTEVRRDTVAQLRVREAQLRGELENMLARDLSELNIEDLRRRVVQLVMELQERNKTEAAQLIAVLENAERKASEKSVEALREQSRVHGDLLRVSLREQEVKLQDDYAQRLDEYIAESTLRIEQVADELKSAHKVNVETKLELARAEHEAEVGAASAEEKAAAYAHANAAQASRVATVEDLRLKLQALDKVFQVNAEYLSNSHQIHLVSTALLALYNSLSDSGGSRRRTSLSEATASLRVAARSDPVIISALESLPKAAMAGVPTLSELEERFALAREESRKALYTRNDSGVVGHAVGSLAAGLFLAPSGGGAQGEGVEACLARAHHYISRGNVRSALVEVGRIEGDAAAVMVDWVEAARLRLLVTQAVRMIGAHVTTLVATLS